MNSSWKNLPCNYSLGLICSERTSQVGNTIFSHHVPCPLHLATSLPDCTLAPYNPVIEIIYSEARRSLAELLEHASQGERITITRQGKPAAELGLASPCPKLDLERLRTVCA